MGEVQVQPEELVRRLLASLPQAGEGGSRVDFPPRFAGAVLIAPAFLPTLSPEAAAERPPAHCNGP